MSRFILSFRNPLQRLFRHISTIRKSVVLGIETSCDDTGCAIVDSEGNILAESLFSQQQIHINHGGIIPPIARDLHQQHIDRVVKHAITHSSVQIEAIDAVATTVKPGLPLSLLVGMKYGKNLANEYKKPFIPIHHMEAHALTVRMIEKVDFPFLVILLSGGHCLLNLVQDVDKFFLLGQSMDDAPGEAFDKFARRLKLHNIREFSSMNGGHAIETVASRGNPLAFHFPLPLAHYKDCNFSFSGLKNAAVKHIERLEREYEVEPDQIVPHVEDLCASFLFGITRHLCHRLQRCMEYIRRRNLLPAQKSLVVSGGVACNKYILSCLKQVCDEYGYQVHVPPPHLCTDNGAMIAWNGIERWRAGVGIIQPLTPQLEQVDIQPRCMLGEDLREDVANQAIKCKWIKLKQINH